MFANYCEVTTTRMRAALFGVRGGQKGHLFTKELLWAGVLGSLSVAISFGLRLSEGRVFFIILRDVLQVGIVGIAAPILIARDRRAFADAGLRFDRPLRHLAIGVAFTALLFVQFLAEGGWVLPAVSAVHWKPALYIMVTNIFEIFFFAIYLRDGFERALGIIPGIILAAFFFSLHHAGFQPEFLKMFGVGVLLISVFRIFRHWLVLFPLWWLGGVWDVLFKAEDIGDIYTVSWVQIGVVVLFVLIGTIGLIRKPAAARDREGVS